MNKIFKQPKKSRLALGSVQFGMPYGIANSSGCKVSLTEVEKIIQFALESGIDTIDTAIAYGESEFVLGMVGVTDFGVVTKIPALPQDVRDIKKYVILELENSLKRLRIQCFEGVLVHNVDDLYGDMQYELEDALIYIKRFGMAKKVGASVYSPNHLNSLINNCEINIVQAPFNVIDRRLLNGAYLDDLVSSNTELHVRSAFLQGLLTMSAESRPRHFQQWSYIFKKWDRWLKSSNITAVEACLSWVLSHKQVYKCVVGVDNLLQLREIVIAELGCEIVKFPDINSTDELLINPSLWK